MLVLSRMAGEAVVLDLGDGRRVRLVIVDHRNHKIRVGFEAPQDVVILREELLNKGEVPSHAEGDQTQG